MKTIGAKELRLHLDQVFDRVLSGEDIIVNHRFKGPVRLSALYSASSEAKPKRLAGLRAFDTAPKQSSPYDPHKSIKELYNESIAKKHVS
jgi:antitoxin (DNA-binding transcriptional repressor) of toxin-antitoxin stability system